MLTEPSPLDLYARWVPEGGEGARYRVEVSQDLEHWTTRVHILPAYGGGPVLFGLNEPYIRVSRR